MNNLIINVAFWSHLTSRLVWYQWYRWNYVEKIGEKISAESESFSHYSILYTLTYHLWKTTFGHGWMVMVFHERVVGFHYRVMRFHYRVMSFHYMIILLKNLKSCFQPKFGIFFENFFEGTIIGSRNQKNLKYFWANQTS